MKPSRKLQRYLEEHPKFREELADVLDDIIFTSDMTKEGLRVEDYRMDGFAEEELLGIHHVINHAKTLDRLITRKRKELR